MKVKKAVSGGGPALTRTQHRETARHRDRPDKHAKDGEGMNLHAYVPGPGGCQNVMTIKGNHRARES